MTQIKTNRNGNYFPVLSEIFDNELFPSNKWIEREFNQASPAVNIIENSKEFNIEFAVPGFKKNDFKINLEENVLTVNAEKVYEKNDKHERFTRKEFHYNSFSRSFTLPNTINAESIDAKYNDGILRLNIPKKGELKNIPKKEIKIA